MAYPYRNLGRKPLALPVTGEELRRMYESPMSVAAIAREIKVSEGRVGAALFRLGVEFRRVRRFSDAERRARAEKCRERKKAARQIELAQKMGISLEGVQANR